MTVVTEVVNYLLCGGILRALTSREPQDVRFANLPSFLTKTRHRRLLWKITGIEALEMTVVTEVANNLLCDGILRALTSRESQDVRFANLPSFLTKTRHRRAFSPSTGSGTTCRNDRYSGSCELFAL